MSIYGTPITASKKNTYFPGENISIINNKISTKAFPCNPNLLDNWYFGNPVNQRGQTSYTGVGYTVDRWKMMQAAGTVIIENGGIVIRKSSGEYVQWGEVLEADVWGALVGRQVTLSALTVNGQLATTTQTFTADGIAQVAAFEGMTFHSAGSLRLFDFVLTGAESPAIRAVKLELGSQQTLAHQENGVWVLNEIPDYGEQLRRCQRYFIRVGDDRPIQNCAVGFANCANTSVANAFIHTPVSMRATPAAVLHKVWLRWGLKQAKVTGVNVFYAATNGIYCALQSSELPVESTVLVRTEDAGYIDFSADL